MKLCISEATTMPASFAEDISAYADAGCLAMEVWLTKLEDHLKANSVQSTRELLAARSMTLAAAAYQGGLLLSQGAERRAHFDHFRRRLDLCQQFAVPTMLVIADFTHSVTTEMLGRAAVSLKQAAQWAAGFDVRLALEFRATASFCSCLETALVMIDQCQEPNVGVNLDVFHYYTGPSKSEDLSGLTAANLAHVQLCDVAGVPRECARDSDRILPGDGDFQLNPLKARLAAINYQGWISLELFNPTLWNAKPTQLAEIGMASLRRFITGPISK